MFYLTMMIFCHLCWVKSTKYTYDISGVTYMKPSPTQLNLHIFVIKALDLDCAIIGFDTLQIFVTFGRRVQKYRELIFLSDIDILMASLNK